MESEPVPILELIDATVVKNDTRVLDGLTLTVRAGEHTAVMGPNGAGKSVLMQLLSYQDRPVPHADGSPSIRVLGFDLWNVFELRPRLGIVSADLHHRFVNGNSRGRIRVLDAVLSGLFGMHGLTPPDTVTAGMREQARDALERMEATHLAGRFLDEMSTGEVRRVLVARALVTTPDALILDEPSTGLDLTARYRLTRLMNRVAETGTTLILVTHQVEEIVPAISQVLLLKKGRVFAAGPRDRVLTGAQLSDLFEMPVMLSKVGGYLQAAVSGEAAPLASG